MTNRKKTARSPGPADLKVAEELKELRLLAGVSQEWIAAKLGITKQQWGCYERGENRIPSGRADEARRLLLAEIGFNEASATAYDPGIEDPILGKLQLFVDEAMVQLEGATNLLRLARSR